MELNSPTTTHSQSAESSSSVDNNSSSATLTPHRNGHQPSLSTISLNESEINLGMKFLNSDTTRKEYRKQNSFRSIMTNTLQDENSSPTTTTSSPHQQQQQELSTLMDSKVEEMFSLISTEYPSFIVSEIDGKSEWERDCELKFILGPSILSQYLNDGDDDCKLNQLECHEPRMEQEQRLVKVKAFLFNKFLFLGRESSMKEYRIIRFDQGNDWIVRGLSDNSTFLNAFCLKLENGERSEIFSTNESSNLKQYWLEQLRRLLDIPIFTEKQMKAIRENIKEYLDENTYSLEELQEYYCNQPISELVQFWDLGESSQYIERKGITQDVHYATTEKVFQLLTDPFEHDGDFLFTFLLTYKSFTTSMDFLKFLMNRYNTPPPIGCNDFQEWKKKLYDIRLRVCEILHAWIQHFFYNFRKDLELQNETHHFIKDVIANSKMIKAASIIQKCWDSKRKQRETFSAQQFQRQQQQLEALKRQLEEEKEKKKPSLFKKLFSFNSNSESEVFASASLSISDNTEDQLLDSSNNIAKQMCMIDMEIFNRIQPKECLNQSWSDSNRRKNAPNIFNFIERSNHLAIYVAFLILNIDTPKRRAKVIEKFIKIAYVLRDLNNFHSMRAIMMSLNSNSIYRLKKSWEFVSQKRLAQYHELEKLVSISANSKTLRDAMKQADLPCLPFMGILLSDLTFFEDGNPDEKDGKINIHKRYQLASIIKRIVEYQKKPYDFPFHDCKSKWSNIYMAGRYTDDDLYNLSLEQEPRQ